MCHETSIPIANLPITIFQRRNIPGYPFYPRICLNSFIGLLTFTSYLLWYSIGYQASALSEEKSQCEFFDIFSWRFFSWIFFRLFSAFFREFFMIFYNFFPDFFRIFFKDFFFVFNFFLAFFSSFFKEFFVTFPWFLVIYFGFYLDFFVSQFLRFSLIKKLLKIKSYFNFVLGYLSYLFSE